MATSKKGLKIILVLLIAGLFIFSGIILSISIYENSAKNPKLSFRGDKFVSKIIDGDTIIIEGESVRLLGIDADEKGYPCYSAAKNRIEELVADAEDKDMYKRYLRYIFLDGENINLKLVQEGLAVARFSPENTKYKDEILAAEKSARENKIGCKWR
ncbi:thermonuclease family protein [Candidatus Pacearchaeota archaeon]|nr:thermonuclease family protein [Candidatus Pacearchaeota archaeon]